MTDQRTRDAVRVAATSGDVEARARALAARVRAGEVTLDRVRVAAYAGHEVARHLLGADAPRVTPRMDRWLLGVQAYGLQACAIAAVGLGRAMMQRVDVGPTGYYLFMDHLGAFWRWAHCPCPQHVAELAGAEWMTRGEGGRFYVWLRHAVEQGDPAGWERWWYRRRGVRPRRDEPEKGRPVDVALDVPSTRKWVAGHLVKWSLDEPAS